MHIHAHYERQLLLCECPSELHGEHRCSTLRTFVTDSPSRRRNSSIESGGMRSNRPGAAGIFLFNETPPVCNLEASALAYVQRPSSPLPGHAGEFACAE